MPLFLQVLQYSGFISTEISNLILLWLIVTKSSSRFGSYKYIMMSYAVFSIVYGVVEILTQPTTHIHGACMLMYVDSFLKYEKSIALVLVGLYCATFGLCVLLLATHFVYRFFAICRPQEMSYFQGARLLRVYTIPISISILWYFTVTILVSPTPAKDKYMRGAINETYGEDTTRLSYLGILYFYKDELSGTQVISWPDFTFCAFACGVMQTCIITMVVCGWKTWRKMESVEVSMSKKTKELNSQLFRTLVLQTTHIHGACMMLYVDSFLKYDKPIALVLVGVYCATFALCVSLLATHFVYRYFAICRPQDMSQFQGVRLLQLYILPIIFSIVWYFVVTVLVAPTARKDEYMREAINETYGEDTSRLSYLGVLYFYKDDSNGKTVIGWPDFTYCAYTCGVMQVCIITMVICGWKTWRKMENVEGSMSKKTKELNAQLFRTLVLQTLIPLCTMFAPVGALIILPIFSIAVGTLANAPSLYAGFYPALDALVVIFMIRDFRNTVLCKFII
ncbi:hypothetical protein GCK72_020824 [Caenorhabditis remanei]|uniref:Serpentine receptor class r-10 n=1 Tax=Caenorhabditis remanei TaxID=31234 RepID=A0A6A5GHL8_CAERE|nr:hypothetical protein GCK72_020824 [Caenorhabditis remanei]KAF1754264.1 hypothetical protein GCK72_020824 [Caenorhabditis remanei]